ncbi:hypothetical protein RSO01_24900 [Reyranella soli]|uniref:Uncharacterized protein n=1 Tax=Reyranella soli TaxID=1230389 RepID=A0A512N8M2_9HYPH|nr:hypothetical protein RSO01_24900 [Reyranella soli]
MQRGDADERKPEDEKFERDSKHIHVSTFDNEKPYTAVLANVAPHRNEERPATLWSSGPLMLARYRA